MKKLVLLLAVVFSVSLFSCGNGEKKAEATDSVAAAEEVVAAEVDTVVAPVDSAAADTVVAEVVEAVAAE
jgi:lipoprotein